MAYIHLLLNWDVNFPFALLLKYQLPQGPHLEGLCTGMAMIVLGIHPVNLSYKILETVKVPSYMTSP